MAQFYCDERNFARKQKSPLFYAGVCSFLLGFTAFLAMILFVIPALGDMYAKQAQTDHEVYLLRMEVEVVKEHNSELEKQLRTLRQDLKITENLAEGRDFVKPKGEK